MIDIKLKSFFLNGTGSFAFFIMKLLNIAIKLLNIVIKKIY